MNFDLKELAFYLTETGLMQKSFVGMDRAEIISAQGNVCAVKTNSPVRINMDGKNVNLKLAYVCLYI